MGTRQIWLILSIFVLQSRSVPAQDQLVFPVPSGITDQLFYLQRTPNTNTVIYALNYKNGELDSLKPVHVFWIRYPEQGQQQELSAIQRKFAYGIESKWIGPDQYELHFLAYKKRVMLLKKSADNKYHVFTEVNKRQMIISRIFLQINGGSLFKPNIEYVEFTGLDAATGLPVKERVSI
jgi:hypothetical protein